MFHYAERKVPVMENCVFSASLLDVLVMHFSSKQTLSLYTVPNPASGLRQRSKQRSSELLWAEIQERFCL